MKNFARFARFACLALTLLRQVCYCVIPMRIAMSHCWGGTEPDPAPSPRIGLAAQAGLRLAKAALASAEPSSPATRQSARYSAGGRIRAKAASAAQAGTSKRPERERIGPKQLRRAKPWSSQVRLHQAKSSFVKASQAQSAQVGQASLRQGKPDQATEARTGVRRPDSTGSRPAGFFRCPSAAALLKLSRLEKLKPRPRRV